jgi:hypothetical protein
MTFKSQQTQAYLLELFRQTSGDSAKQISMFEVGAAIGLEKNQAQKTAEDLIAQGWVEIKTLSGGIGITAEGLEAAQGAGAAGDNASDYAVLGSHAVMDDQDRLTITALVNEIKSSLQSISAPYQTTETLVLDIKTLEVHLLSSQAKTAVVREILRSLQDGLQAIENKPLVRKIQQTLGN